MARSERAQSEAIAELRARLISILDALAARDVRLDRGELMFTIDGASGLDVRLGGDPATKCFARGANLTISYASRDGAPASQAFFAAADLVKEIDAAPIEGAAGAFAVAAQATAAHYGVEPVQSRREEPSDALGAIFLDVCARLTSTDGETPAALHWGFWPAGSSLFDPAYDPFQAYSEHLLSYVPHDATRILDVGCGLGVNAKLLGLRGKRVTALSPVRQHCDRIAKSGFAGVDVVCAPFGKFEPRSAYDLLLFSESANHFALDDAFFEYCASLLSKPGYVLLADDLTGERAAAVESQRILRVTRAEDISANVAPMVEWWRRHLEMFSVYNAALLSILGERAPELLPRVVEVLDSLGHEELGMLFSGEKTAPRFKGRYMIYLLAS